VAATTLAPSPVFGHDRPVTVRQRRNDPAAVSPHDITSGKRLRNRPNPPEPRAAITRPDLGRPGRRRPRSLSYGRQPVARSS
jgi:hypothetical protein